MNLEQQIFYADSTLSLGELQCNITLEKGELIPKYCEVECEIEINNTAQIINNAGTAWEELDFTDQSHGELIEFFVNKSVPIFALSNVLVTLDNEIILNTSDLRPLEEEAYANKYAQQQLIQQAFVPNQPQANADMCDVLELTRVGNVLHYSFRLSDFLPLVFQDRVMNISEQLQLQINLKNTEKWFWMSNLNGVAGEQTEIVNFLNYSTDPAAAYAQGVLCVRNVQPTMSIEVNCLYEKQPIPDELSIVTQTIPIIETKNKIETSVKLSDSMLSQFQTFILFNDSNPFDCNLINEDQLKSNGSFIQIYRNNSAIFNPQESSAYNQQGSQSAFTQYLKKMLAIEEPNNNTFTKSVGEISLETYVNKLIEYRLTFTGAAAYTTKTCFYVNYVNENL